MSVSFCEMQDEKLHADLTHLWFLCSLQLKGQMMLLEAQLEKQLESITISQTYAEEMSQVKPLTDLIRLLC